MNLSKNASLVLRQLKGEEVRIYMHMSLQEFEHAEQELCDAGLATRFEGALSPAH